jgi:L-glutamine-phosphate cytidylyltransferase
MNYTGIILAAGRGARLKKKTDEFPKCLIKLKGKTLLERVVENFNENKIIKIHVVTGYKKNKIILPSIKKIFNRKWNRSSIMTSLLCCNKILRKNNCIISYSDILYTKKNIEALKKMKGDICLLSNNNWKKIWKQRFTNPLSDLETFKVKNNQLTSIGEKPLNTKDIQGQYMGLIKITPNGWKKMVKHIDIYYNNKINHLDITNFLSTFIKNKKNKVFVKKINSWWFEIDNQKDLMVAKKLS